MKLLENEWQFLSDIIYKMNSENEISVMRKSLLESIRILIPYDELTFYLYDGCNLHSPIYINCNESVILKYLDSYKEIDYISWILNSSRSAVLRETDLLPDEIREDTIYYKEYYLPSNLHFCIVLALAYEGVFLGIISLFRTKDKSEFSEKEASILDILKDHLSLRLYRFLYQENTPYQIEQNTEEILKRILDKYKLTKREAEILKFLEEGHTNQDISNMLFISLPTLKRHISNIYKKFNVKNRFQLSKKLTQKDDL